MMAPSRQLSTSTSVTAPERDAGGETVRVVTGWYFISHWLIDGFQLAARWGAIAGQSSTYFVRIVVDQTFHLLVTAALLEWLL